VTRKSWRQYQRRLRLKQRVVDAKNKKKTRAGAIHSPNPEYANKGIRRLFRDYDARCGKDESRRRRGLRPLKVGRQ